MKVVKLTSVIVFIVTILSFSVIGMISTWKTYLEKDYSRELTEEAFVSIVNHQDMNLVFYRQGCVYCEAGKKSVIESASESSYPTFYINVESEKGQEVVKNYQVDKAATLLTIRNGEVETYLYATKDTDGHIKADQKAIKVAFDD